jgi:TIR domain
VLASPKDMFEYDVAISFAGEQRAEAEAIADCLKSAGVNVFYDRYEQADLWGKNLYEHLSDVYQKKARYCLMLVSAAYAAKVWPTHERRNAQARALLQSTEYILPVRFDETEIPGLPGTVGYLRFEQHGVQGIYTNLLQKLNGSLESPERHTATERAVAPELKDFWEQRRRLADTDILKKVWSKPRWRIGIRPTEFKRARFKDLEQCRQFMISSYVRVQGWFPYPWFSKDALESGDEWIAGEIDMSEPGRVSHMERWVLFRSAQFAHNRAFDEIPQLGDRVHVLEILDTATAAFEFAARMAQHGVLSPEAVITFELYGLAGRGLTWPKDIFGDSDSVEKDCWCQDESFAVARQSVPANLQAKRRELALEVAVEIYSAFGWADSPKDLLREAQLKRFGAF